MIGEERNALVDRWRDVNLEVLDHVPEELVPPCIVLTGDEDYLLEGDDFSESWLMRLEAFLLVELTGNEQAAEDLDQLLTEALPQLGLWSLNAMSKPGPFHTTQWLAHGVRLSLSTETTLTNQE